jgi:hypothetical protein
MQQAENVASRLLRRFWHVAAITAILGAGRVLGAGRFPYNPDRDRLFINNFRE